MSKVEVSLACYDVTPVLFEDKNTIDPRYANKRAEMWVTLSGYSIDHLARQVRATRHSF